MPTIGTYSGALPFMGGYIQGQTAQEIYNQKVIRDQAQQDAENQFRQMQFQVQKEANDLARLDRIDKEKTSQVQWEKEMQYKYDALKQQDEIKKAMLSLKEQQQQSRIPDEDVVKNTVDALESGDVVFNPARTGMETPVKMAVINEIANRKKMAKEAKKDLYTKDPLRAEIELSWGKDQLPPSVLDGLNVDNALVNRIDTLNKTLLENKSQYQVGDQVIDLAPIIGALKKLDPWNTGAKIIEAQVNNLLGVIAKKVGLDTGALSNQDIDRSKKSIGDINKPTAVNELLAKLITQAVLKGTKTKLSAYSKAYYTKPALPFLDSIEEYDKSLHGEIGSKSSLESCYNLPADMDEEDISYFNSLPEEGKKKFLRSIKNG